MLLFAGMLALTSAWLTGDGTGVSDPAWVLYYVVPAVAAVWLVRRRDRGGPRALGRGARQPRLVGVFGAGGICGVGGAGADVHGARCGLRRIAPGPGLGCGHRCLFCRSRLRQA